MEESLSQRLVKARSGHGWSQADLAEVSGVAAAQISRYEAGRSKPRMEVVAKLARAMAVSFDWLAYGKGSAEAGLDVPTYPVTQKLLHAFDFEAHPELLDTAERLAKEMGLTIEMTIKQALLSYARSLKEETLDSDKGDEEPKSKRVRRPPRPA